MQFRTEPFKNTIMPFNSFHKKRIVKDVPPLYLYKSKYSEYVYLSYISEFTGECVIEIRDRDMNELADINNTINMEENIILIDETETDLYFVSENYKLYEYQKNGRKLKLLHNFMPDIPESMLYYKMVTSNGIHIIILINNDVWTFNKETKEIDYIYHDIFNLNDYFFIMTKDGAFSYLADKKGDNIITKDRAMSKEGTIIEPLFLGSMDDILLVCCKNTYTKGNNENSVKKVCHDYFLFVFQYKESFWVTKNHEYIVTKKGEKFGTSYKSTMFQITDGYIPTCLNTFDKHAVLGFRHEGERILSFVDIPKLMGTNGSTLNVDDYKKYGTTFKNANFTSVVRDNTYIYAGSENGDVTIFSINDLNDKDENYRIITKNGEHVIDLFDNYISYIPGSEIELTYRGTSKFFLNNVCNGKIDIMHVDNHYLYAASSKNHDITIYVRHTKPFIVNDSEILHTYMVDNKYSIIYKATVDHDDILTKFRYRIRMVGNNKEITLRDWSRYNYAKYNIDECMIVDIDEIDGYNYKLIVDIEDVNSLLTTSEHELDMLLDKECRIFSNKVIIPYKTIPDQDLTMEYSVYKMVNGTLVLVDSNEFNILSSYRSEWLVTVTEDFVYEYDEETQTINKVLSPHLNTEEIYSHNFDYIEIPMMDINDILYLTYTFKSKDGWCKRNPENNEYYIYDMSEFYKTKAVAKADGGISVVDKFNVLDLSYGPGIELVNSIMLRTEYGNTYELRIDSTGTIALEKVITLSENVADNATLCFRVLDQDKHELGIKAPDGKVWDFDVILNSNGYSNSIINNEEYGVGRTARSLMNDQHLFLYKNDYNVPDIEAIVKALSNPIKSAYIENIDIDNYRLLDNCNKYGEFINTDHRLKYTMHPEGLAEETFKDHNHYFNVYIDGLKLPNKFIENDTDKQGEYSVKFIYDEINPNYNGKDIEIELMHSDNIDSEKIVKKAVIQTEKDIEDLYKGEYVMYIPTLQKGIDLKEFKLFIEYPLVNSTYRMDNCNFVIKRDELNPSKIYIKLKNYILNNIGCTLVLTTIDVDKELMYVLDDCTEFLTTKKNDFIVSKNGDKIIPKQKIIPYYYVPLMKYDQYGNLTYYYTDDIRSFNVVVDGYTLMPNVDYTLVNLYLHSHMPSIILFNDILNPDTNVEIIFNNDDVSDIITLTDNDSSLITVNDGRNMFIEGCFSVFAEGRKLASNQYKIIDPQHIQLLVKTYKRVIIRFQYKGYENLSSLIEILYSRRSNPSLYNVDSHIMGVSDIKYNNYLEHIGYEDKEKIGKLYLIEAFSDKCFRDQTDAVFDCNIDEINMFDVHIDCSLNYELPYINNDIIIDSNECYNKADFTMLNMPTDRFLIPEDNIDINPPVFTEQPNVKEIDIVPGEVMITFKVKDAESIFFKYEISLDGENYKPLDKFKVAGNRVFVYLRDINPGSHMVQFNAIDENGLNTESKVMTFIVAGSGYTTPVFSGQPQLVSSINELNAKFNIEAFSPYNNGLSLYLFINDSIKPIYLTSTASSNIEGIFKYSFKNYGTYTLTFGLLSGYRNKNENVAGLDFKKSRPIIVTFEENKKLSIDHFILDNIDPYDKYITTHAVLSDPDTDIKSMIFKPYLDGNPTKNYKINLINNMAYIYFDNIEPGNHTIALEASDKFNTVTSNLLNFDMNDLSLDIKTIRTIHNVVLDKFGNLSFEYSVEDKNNMGLTHEISYNGLKYTQIKPIRYDNKYIFMGNIGTKLDLIKNLKLKVTNSIGKEVILEYSKNLKLPINDSIRINPNIFIEINNEERIFVRYTAINSDDDLLYVYYSLDDTPWIRAYPREVNNIGGYSFPISDITKGKHALRIKVSDGITNVISRYVNFEL